jgi:hypothetical protein
MWQPCFALAFAWFVLPSEKCSAATIDNSQSFSVQPFHVGLHEAIRLYFDVDHTAESASSHYHRYSQHKSTSFVRNCVCNRSEPGFSTHSDLWNEIYLSLKSTKQVLMQFLAVSFWWLLMDGHGEKNWVCLSTLSVVGWIFKSSTN